jgi:hypothetical protein
MRCGSEPTCTGPVYHPTLPDQPTCTRSIRDLTTEIVTVVVVTVVLVTVVIAWQSLAQRSAVL